MCEDIKTQPNLNDMIQIVVIGSSSGKILEKICQACQEGGPLWQKARVATMISNKTNPDDKIRQKAAKYNVVQSPGCRNEHIEAWMHYFSPENTIICLAEYDSNLSGDIAKRFTNLKIDSEEKITTLIKKCESMFEKFQKTKETYLN